MPRARLIVVALVVLACLPPVLAAGRAIAEDWMPVGDNGALAIHAHDVLTANSPLLGTRTTLGGPEFDGRVRHLGPLEFWALAVPERIARSAPWGIVVGVALAGIVSILGVAWAVRRVDVGANGSLVLAVALAVTVLVCWSLGRQLLADPWNPYVAVLPLVAALFLAWSAAAGNVWALAPLALAASWVAQAHLLFAPLAVLLLGGAAVVAVARRQITRPVVLATGATLAVAWSFPVWEQITTRPGNMVELARAYRAEDATGVGWAYALRTMARTLAGPPVFARPASSLGRFGDTLPLVSAVLALAVVGALAFGTVAALRRGRVPAAAAGAVALGSLAVTAVTTAQVPVGFPDVAFYRMLQLWPVSAFAWFALVVIVVQLVELPAVSRTGALVAASAVVAGFAVAVVATESAHPEDLRHMDAVRALADAAEPVTGDTGGVRVVAEGEAQGQILYGLVRELLRRGVEAGVDADDVYIADGHTAAPSAPTVAVFGGEHEPPAGGAEIARWDAATDAEREEYARLHADLRARLSADGVLTAAGRAAVADRVDADAIALGDVLAGRLDPLDALARGVVLRSYGRGWVERSAVDATLTDRIHDLRYIVEALDLTMYLVPGG